MALYLQQNRYGIEDFGQTVTIPNNDVARLMYYLDCVCSAVDCKDDSNIQRFISYNNWSHLSIDDQKALVAICYVFSPDVLDDHVFFHSDALCGNSLNKFYKISEIRNQVLAAESIIIAGQTRQVNKIMTYTMRWMTMYYIEPMKNLAQRLFSQPSLRPLPSPPRPLPSPPRSYSPIKDKDPICKCTKKRCCIGICIAISLVILISIIISIVDANRK